MLLVFGGTTEGRSVANALEDAGLQYFYSTQSELQKVEMHHGLHVTGGMDGDEMLRFCNENRVECIVDAAHPFATNLRNNIAKTASSLHIPVIRYQRESTPVFHNAIYCDDFNDAIDKLSEWNAKHLLALCGANSIRTLRPYWEKHHTIFRILDRKESREQAEREGLDACNIIFYPLNAKPSLDDEMELMRELGCDAMLTKDSGVSGGLDIKVQAAQSLGIKVFIVKSPCTPNEFIRVSNREELLMAIKLVP